MPAPYYAETWQLLSGQSYPYTGGFVPTSMGRTFAIYTYGSGNPSGNSAVILSCPSPFPAIPGTMPFLTIPVTGNGWNNIILLTTPSNELQASVSGSGAFWCALLLKD